MRTVSIACKKLVLVSLWEYPKTECGYLCGGTENCHIRETVTSTAPSQPICLPQGDDDEEENEAGEKEKEKGDATKTG